MNLLKQIALTWIQYRHFQAVLAELKRLPDHELSDLGLARGDIVRAAFEEAERRTEAAFARSRPKGTLRGGEAMAPVPSGVMPEGGSSARPSWSARGSDWQAWLEAVGLGHYGGCTEAARRLGIGREHMSRLLAGKALPASPWSAWPQP
jgi:uncharacterized protein YjiS (DUF1127 family)